MITLYDSDASMMRRLDNYFWQDLRKIARARRADKDRTEGVVSVSMS
jgi:hypothetical protein